MSAIIIHLTVWIELLRTEPGNLGAWEPVNLGAWEPGNLGTWSMRAWEPHSLEFGAWETAGRKIGASVPQSLGAWEPRSPEPGVWEPGAWEPWSLGPGNLGIWSMKAWGSLVSNNDHRTAINYPTTTDHRTINQSPNDKSITER